MTMLYYFNPDTGKEVEIDDGDFDNTNTFANFNNKATSKGYVQEIEMNHPEKGTKFVPGNLIKTAQDKGWRLPPTSDKPDTMSIPNAILTSAAKGATLGFSDELAGALMSGYEKATGFGNKNDTESLGDKYTRYRDIAREQQNQAAEQYPTASTVGELVGGIAAPIGAIGNVAKGAGLLSKVGIGALTGAGIGAVSGAGYSDKPIQEELPDVATGAVVGGSVGGVLPVAGKALSKLKPIPNKISTAIKTQIISPTKGERVNDFLASIKGDKGNIEDTIQSLSDQGIFKGEVLTKEQLATKAQTNIETKSNELNDILSDIKPNQQTFTFDNTNELLNSQILPSDKVVINNLLNATKDQIKNAKTLTEINQVKQKIYDKIGTSYSRSDLSPQESMFKQAYKTIANDLKQGIEDNFEEVSLRLDGSTPDTEGVIMKLNPKKDVIKSLNKDIGANLYLRDKLASRVDDKLINLSDIVTGGLGGGLSLLAHPGLGLSLAAGKIAWKTTPTKMVSIKILDGIDALVNNGQLERKVASSAKYKFLQEIQKNPNITIEEFNNTLNPQEQGVFKQITLFNPRHVGEPTKRDEPYGKPSEQGSVSEAPKLNIVDSKTATNAKSEVQKQLDDMFYNQFKLKQDDVPSEEQKEQIRKLLGTLPIDESQMTNAANPVGMFMYKNPDTGQLEKAVNIIESRFREGGSDTNSVMLKSGKILLPGEKQAGVPVGSKIYEHMLQKGLIGVDGYFKKKL